MNISSYNITDVGYHYIGLRVVGAQEVTKRDDQVSAISVAVGKYVRDRALRLMLPATSGTFETVGKKVCQELAHLGLAQSARGAYVLTELGMRALALLNARQTRELRILMIRAHVETYDNLRYALRRHIELGEVLRPVVEAGRANDPGYLASLLTVVC